MASRTHGITLRDLGPVGDILFAGDGIGGQVPKRRHLTILKSLALEGDASSVGAVAFLGCPYVAIAERFLSRTEFE